MSDLFDLHACQLCPRKCGVDRLNGKRGYCGAGPHLEIAYCGPHHGEEPPISGTKGSGTLFLNHCTMTCVFCQNWQISQNKTQKHERQTISLEAIANCHNINLVSPTQYLTQLLPLIKKSTQPIVYNTNGYERVEILKALHGYIQIYLPDMKYADNALAKKYSNTPDYVAYNQAAIKEMYQQVGNLETNADGLAIKGLIIRHLVLPNHLENSKRCLDFIAQLDPTITVSIMAQYSPQYQVEQYSHLNRKLTTPEYAEILSYAGSLGLENCYSQELESQEVFIPDFKKENPF